MPFQKQGFTQTREVRGGNKLVKVREWRGLSLPSETYFQFRRDQTQPCYASPDPCFENIAFRIEGVLANALVSDVVYSQDTSAGGRLVDMMTTYWQSEDGAVEGSIEQPLKEFSISLTIPLVEAEASAASGLVGA